MAEDNKKKQTGLVAFGQGIKSFGRNYIPSGTSHISYDKPKGYPGWKTSGESFKWKRGVGEYIGQKESTLESVNKRRGWSKGGKTHKNIKTQIFKQRTYNYPMTKTLFKGRPEQLTISRADGSPVSRGFASHKGRETVQKTTWRTSIKGGELAKQQTGLGRDRFGLSIKESKKFGKGITYKGNVGVTVDIFGNKNRKVLKGAEGYIFPKDSKHAVHYLDKAGNVKGLISKQSKLGGWISTKNTVQLGKMAKTAGKGLGRLATGASGIGTAWLAYDLVTTSFEQQKNKAPTKKQKIYGMDVNTSGKYGVDY